MQFQPNSPEVYQQKPTYAPGGSEPGLLGNDGLGSFLANVGMGFATGNWAPLIGGAIGGGDVGGAAAGAATGKNSSKKPGGDGEEDPSELNKTDDPNNPENDIQLASERMVPELGQPMQLTAQAAPQPYRDPMKWWSPA